MQRVTTLTILLAASVGVAQATELGNRINPRERDVFCLPDPQGSSLFIQHQRASPSGLRFQVPCRLPESPRQAGSDDADNGDTQSNWVTRTQLEAGILSSHGDDRESLYNEYSDWSDGLVLSALRVSAQDRAGENFVELRASSPWRDDGFASLDYLRPNSLTLQASYDRIPHRYANDIQTIFAGLGTDHLRLPADLSPGLNSVDDIAAAIDQAPLISSEIERTRYGLDISYRPLPGWRLTAHYQRDEREGTRPFSAANSFSFLNAGVGSSVELLEPIDYVTNELELGVEWAAGPWALRAAWYGSFFSNDIPSLTFENPFTNGSFVPLPDGAFVAERGRFALAPDNDFNQFKLDLRRALPWQGSVSGALHYSQMRQDDALLPHTVNTGLSGTSLQEVDLTPWSSVDGLSASRADTQIDTLLAVVDLRLRPARSLTLRSRLRWLNEDNESDYLNFNPLTGEYGYIVEDATHGSIFPFESGIFVPGMPGSEWHIRSIPFARDEREISLGADWRVAAKTTLSAELRRDEIDRDFRQVEETDENRLRLSINHRGFERATLRASFESASRSGSGYDPFPYAEFWTDSLPGFEPAFADGRTAYALTSMRMHDVADRDQDQVELRLHLLLSDRSDLAFSTRYQRNDYDARHGLRNKDLRSANLEYSFLPSAEQRYYLWVSTQSIDSDMATIRDLGPISANGDPGGPVFPLETEWQAFFEDQSLAAGIGLSRPLGPLFLQLDLSHIDSDSAIAYRYTALGALATPQFADEAGSGFPDITWKRSVAETSVTWPFRRDWALRLWYRYERGRIADWHYDQAPTVSNRALYLGVDPNSYDAHAVGVLLQYQFVSPAL